MKYQEKELECIHCGKGFKMNEIFIAHMKDDGFITISCHLDCGEASSKKEKEGGWVVIQRTLKGYELQPKPINK
jgi:hypothetical protein